MNLLKQIKILNVYKNLRQKNKGKLSRIKYIGEEQKVELPSYKNSVFLIQDLWRYSEEVKFFFLS